MKVHLAGKGELIPDFVLLPSDIDPSGVGLTLMLGDGATFEKADYVALGYTNFEVICIGAAGGRGGSFAAQGYTNLGGAGGGGGLHRVSGLLADLPDSCAVAVGQGGADGHSSDNNQLSLLVTVVDDEIVGPDSADPNPAYDPELSGEDGGGSSFGEICLASGGQGGWPPAPDSVVVVYGNGPDDWNEYVRRMTSGRLGGNGGTGGIGGTLEVGGGGVGAAPFWDQPCELPRYKRGYNNPGIGSWDDAIGQGGGGGSGGTYHATNAPASDFSNTEYSVAQKLAANGAKGSFSYADTSVYGVGQPGIIIIPAAPRVFPGAGGGARINKAAGYGSHAVGYSPNGAVFLRLTKVD